MKTLNIFIENIYEKFEIDEVKILENLKKITSYLLNDEQVYSQSCLKDYKFDTLVFDVVFCDDEKIHQINKEYRQYICPSYKLH